MFVSVHAREPVCALQSFRPEKRQKSGEFFRITDFFVRERAIVARKVLDAHASASGDDPACDRGPGCTGYGADGNRQDPGVPDSADGTAPAGEKARSDGAGACAYARISHASSRSV